MIRYRPAEVDDSAAVARLICRAGGGLMEFMLEGILPNCSPTDLLELAVSSPDSSISHANAIVGECDDQVMALLLCYPSEEFGLPDILQSAIPADRLAHLAALFATPPPPSLYVNSVAVDAAFSGQGIGKNLMAIADDLAMAQQAPALSLHVWADNRAAIGLYEQFGYRTHHHLAVARHPLLDHDGGKLLMVKPL